MFEALTRRVARRADERARARSRELAARLSAELPGGIAAEADEAGVRLSGRGVRRRFALDPKLRWIVTELIK